MKQACITVASLRQLPYVRALMERIGTLYPGSERIAYLLDGGPLQEKYFEARPASALFTAEAYRHMAFVYSERLLRTVVTVQAVPFLLAEYDSVVFYPWGCKLLEAQPGWSTPGPANCLEYIVDAATALPVRPDIKYLFGLNDRQRIVSPVWRAGKDTLPFWQLCADKMAYLAQKGLTGEDPIGYRYDPFRKQSSFYADWQSYAQVFDMDVVCTPVENLNMLCQPLEPMAFHDFTPILEKGKAVLSSQEYAPDALNALANYSESLTHEGAYTFGQFTDGVPVEDILRLYYAYDVRMQQSCEGKPFESRRILLEQNCIAGDTHLLLHTAPMRAIWLLREDLQNAFPQPLESDRLAYTGWYLLNGAAEYSLPSEYVTPVQDALDAYNWREQEALAARSIVAKLCDKMKTVASEAPKNLRVNHHEQEIVLNGVNLCGFTCGDFGVAESLRIVAETLEAADIPFTIVDYQPRSGEGHSYTDMRWRHKITNRFIYNTNVIVTSPPDTLQFIQSVAPEAMKNRRTIGYWAWELPEFPESWLPYLDCVDEIWTNSNFAADAFKTVTQKPVFVLPCCIRVADVAPLQKSDFGLREDAFTFLMMYDVMSSRERKNPEAVVQAFLSKFKGREDVQLAIKVSAPPDWRYDDAISQAVEQNSNMVYLRGTYPRSKINALLASCDAFVSLHRSEGFGLGPAEAMYLGKPCVLTNWSGNTQYMTGDNCCPVDCEIIEIENNFAEYRRGRHWAQPNIAQAAEYMERLVADKQYCESVGIQGQRTITEQFNSNVLGALAKQYLVENGRL